MRQCIKKSNAPLEFMQLTEKNRDGVLFWLSGSGKPGLQGGILLNTPESGEGAQYVTTYSYIIKGFSQEQGWHFWPVKPDYFEENYIEITNIL